MTRLHPHFLCFPTEPAKIEERPIPVKLPAESYRNRCRANVRAVCASNTEERQILNSSCIRWFGSGRRAGLVGALAFVSSVATFATFGFDAGNVACAQVVKAPRYTGGVENPLPQLNLPPLPPAITPHGTVVEDVVVRVNDQIITRSDVERAEQQLEKDAAEQNVPASDVAVKQRDMLRDMIDQQLLLSKAKELGLNVDADVIRELDDIRKKNNMSSLEDLERAAAQSGINYDDFKAKIRDQMLTQQVVRDEVGRRLQMSQSDEAAYYQAHLKEYQQPEQIRLSEILVPLPDTATPAEIVQAQKKAEALKTKLTEGGDFADLAKKYSGGPSAAQGGDLGMWKRGALAPVLEQATFSLKAGQSTEPIRTRQGFVILKVTQHDDAGPAPLSAVEPQIQEAMYMNAMQPALRAYLTKLREQSYVDIAPGFVDSGASPLETKPVFSAYAPPVAKVKKNRVKARFDRNTGRYTAVAAAPVVASPDTTGGRTLTGKEAEENTDASTGLAKISAPVTNSKGKVKTAKREKVRFGQAPRNSLPAAPADEAAETPAVTASTVRPSNTLGGISGDGESANLDDNPLSAKAPTHKKTRFADRAHEVQQRKVKVATARQIEKVKAKPIPESTDEKTADKVQDAPLGLNGDTSKKPKKAAPASGAPKGRLEDRKKETPAQAAPIDPTASPSLAPVGPLTPVPTQPAAPVPGSGQAAPTSNPPSL
jgi:peptidyl-prolyl cis-trans isomerase SurA